MNKGHEHVLGPQGAQERALGPNDCERLHSFSNMANGRKGGQP
jgi:hypothetical protein